jgi:hypothetical protein
VSNRTGNSGVLLPYSINRRVFLVQSAAVAASTLLSSCGGGGSSNPPTPTPTPPSLGAVAISSTTPSALSAITVKLSGFDSKQPFTVSFADPSGNQIAQAPVRFETDGTIVIAAPLHIDASTGNTSSFSTTLTITQNGSSVSTSIVINDIPQLDVYGLPVGLVSRAFYIHQAIALGQSINAQQAISLLPNAGGANATLLANLQTQLLNVIKARNDIDRIVQDNSVSIPIGSAPDGTEVGFDVSSVTIMDRVILQYLLAYTNNGTIIPARAKTNVRRHAERLIAKAIANLSSGQVSAIIQGIATLSGSASFKTTQQTLTDPKSSTLDNVLSVASTATTLVTVGATVISLGDATLAGAPAIAAAPGAVATYRVIAGLLVGSLSMGNDLYNVATNTYGWITGQAGSSAADVGKAGSALVSDEAIAYLNAEGLGGLNGTAGVGPIAKSVFKAIFDVASADVQLSSFGLLSTVQNVLIQSALSSDTTAASNSVQSVAPSNFGQVQGTLSISNSQGPILAGLTGVGAGNNGSAPDALIAIGAPDGTYDLALPLGSPSLTYTAMDMAAFDPVDLYDPETKALIVLDSSVVDLSGINSNTPLTGPSFIGTCKDGDAGSPDADDPDCD